MNKIFDKMGDAGKGGWSQEVQRQSALLQALRMSTVHEDNAPLWALSDAPAQMTLGLEAYRRNATAQATYVLGLAYPTLRTLVGAPAFDDLARSLWRTHPPRLGDLTRWGEALGLVLSAHESWRDWPYLADCARLDWAMHTADLHEPVTLDADSLQSLNTHEPHDLRLCLMPGLALISSPWPIVDIWRAHQMGEDAERETALRAVREAIAERRGQTAVVVQRDWETQVQYASNADASWMRCLLEGSSLGAALDTMAASHHIDFDLSVWLVTALQQGWIWRVEPLSPHEVPAP